MENGLEGLEHGMGFDYGMSLDGDSNTVSSISGGFTATWLDEFDYSSLLNFPLDSSAVPSSISMSTLDTGMDVGV